jgi:hypothetical protein
VRRRSSSCVWCSPVRERVPALVPFAAVGGVLGLCCGLPVLFSLGVLGAVAGLSVSSWALIGLGLVLGALGWARWVWRRRSTAARCRVSALRTPQDSTPDRCVSTTKGHQP